MANWEIKNANILEIVVRRGKQSEICYPWALHSRCRLAVFLCVQQSCYTSGQYLLLHEYIKLAKLSMATCLNLFYFMESFSFDVPCL